MALKTPTMMREAVLTPGESCHGLDPGWEIH